MPEVDARLWGGRFRAAGVSMPEAAVDEYGQLRFGENNIRTPGKVFSAYSKSKPLPMKRRPQSNLWLGVLTLYRLHHSSARAWRYGVQSRRVSACGPKAYSLLNVRLELSEKGSGSFSAGKKGSALFSMGKNEVALVFRMSSILRLRRLQPHASAFGVLAKSER